MPTTWVIEDGTGVAGANTYVDVPYADQFFADREVAEWGQITDPDQKKAYLIQAIDYFGLYAWPLPASADQGLPLPSRFMTQIPEDVKKAQCIVALDIKQNGPIAPSTSAGQVTYEREKLEGVGETETHYENAPTGGARLVPLAAALLRRWVSSTPGAGIQQSRRTAG